MPSACKLFSYLFYVWRKYDVTVTFMTLMSCDSVCCVCGEDWWLSWPMANTFACLCSCQWWTFWTYLVTVNLFSLYLMLLTTLGAVGNILRVHYKSVKCDVSFSQGSVSTLFRWGEHVFSCMCKNVNEFFQSYDHKCTATSFLNHSVQ